MPIIPDHLNSNHIVLYDPREQWTTITIQCDLQVATGREVYVASSPNHVWHKNGSVFVEFVDLSASTEGYVQRESLQSPRGMEDDITIIRVTRIVLPDPAVEDAPPESAVHTLSTLPTPSVNDQARTAVEVILSVIT